MSNKIQLNILDQGLCIGCGLCAGIDTNVQMQEQSNSHYEPSFGPEPISKQFEETILTCCPGTNVHHQQAAKNTHEVVWGSYESISVGHSKNEQLRHQASSGGALSALAICLLEQNLVDAVIHVGKSESDPLRNDVFVSETPEQVQSRAGSRYSPCSLLSKLGDILADDRTYALIGKPCDIDAMRQFLRFRPEYQSKVGYLLSFFCAGQPTFAATDRLLEKLETEKKDLTDFRYRGHGWPGKATAVRKDGSVSECTYDESWGQILGRDLHLRCRICPDAVGMLADISCADAWDCDEKGYPVFEERPGKSLVIARNQTGQELLRLAVEKNYLSLENYLPEKLSRIQTYQQKRRTLVLSRLMALRLCGIKGIRFKGLNLFKNMLRGNLIHNWKNFAGTISRYRKSQ